MTTCECGCGQTTKISPTNNPAKGWVKGQHRRFVHGHNGRKKTRYLVEDRGYTTPCWVWQLHLRQNTGYGQSGSELAHREFYRKYKGEIPTGTEVHHLCSVRSCVNPDHLEAVSHVSNVRLGANAKLSREQVEAIRASEVRPYLLCVEYGVSETTIRDIRTYRSWK